MERTKEYPPYLSLEYVGAGPKFRIDKESLGDLSLSEIWTGLTMPHSTREQYGDFITAAVTESFKKAKSPHFRLLTCTKTLTLKTLST